MVTLFTVHVSKPWYFTGIWQVTLDPVEAGGPYNVTATAQNSTATLTDVLFGDVWLCGGQSNMYFKTSQVDRACLSDEHMHAVEVCL